MIIEDYMPHKITYIFISVLFIACYSLRANVEKPPVLNAAYSNAAQKKIDDPWQTLSDARFFAMPESVTPGEYTTIIYVPLFGKVDGMSNINAALYNAAGKKISSAGMFLFKIDDAGHSALAALITPPSTTESGGAVIKIEHDKKTLAKIPLEIKKRDFAAEVIPLNPANTNLRTVPDPQKTAEAQKLWSILQTTGSDIWSMPEFETPVAANTRRSSFFGDRRVYKYSDGTSATSVHAGIDYAVPKNTPVKSCAAGKVILARQRIVTGNSIIIEHLPGVYSIYYHLEKINAQENAMVKAGDVIGLSGSTGLSTGPHLHWEIRVSTENADPDAFCARPPLDKMNILKIIFNRNNAK